MFLELCGLIIVVCQWSVNQYYKEFKRKNWNILPQKCDYAEMPELFKNQNVKKEHWVMHYVLSTGPPLSTTMRRYYWTLRISTIGSTIVRILSVGTISSQTMLVPLLHLISLPSVIDPSMVWFSQFAEDNLQSSDGMYIVIRDLTQNSYLLIVLSSRIYLCVVKELRWRAGFCLVDIYQSPLTFCATSNSEWFSVFLNSLCCVVWHVCACWY